MNNRENTGEGYREVSEEELRNYIASFPEGERAYFIKLIEKEDPRYYMLYQIRPGVTSYATLYNGYTDTMDKMLIRLQYDLDYLEHRSWSLDATIVLKTFLYIVSGKYF